MAGPLNYEAKDQHTVIVRAIGGSGLHKVTSFAIAVVDVNDEPEARAQTFYFLKQLD